MDLAPFTYAPENVADRVELDYDPLSCGNLQAKFEGFSPAEIEAMHRALTTPPANKNVTLTESSSSSTSSSSSSYSRTLRDLQQADTESDLGRVWPQHELRGMSKRRLFVPRL